MIDKNKLRESLTLYLVTDRGMVEDGDLTSVVERAIIGGVSIVQIREKGLNFDEFLARGREIKSILDKHNIPLIINDNIDICIALDAYGVHLGQADGSIAQARIKLGVDKIIGASARTIEGARLAVSEGADYLGVGAVFGTSTKLDAHTITTEILAGIIASIDVPVVAIGGVSECNIAQLEGSRISGVAVISAILKADNITEKSRELRGMVDKIKNCN